MRRLRSARREFTGHPAFAQWHVWAALPDAEMLRESLRKEGIETRPLADALCTLDDAIEYVRAALDERAWDAATVEVDGALAALERIELATGPSSPVRSRGIARRRFAQMIGTLFLPDDERARSLAAWRRLDVALCRLARVRSALARSPDGAWWRVRSEAASLGRLRSVVRRALVHSQRETKKEADRLLEEAQEGADYAVAALEQRAWASVATDLERVDSALRALRHIVQRESPVYLPEPWPLRVPGRWAALQTMRGERVALTRRGREETG